jgi:hypothetical protein
MGFDEQAAWTAMSSALIERGLTTASDVQADLVTQPFYNPAEQTHKTVDTTNSPADEVDPQAAELDAAVFAPPSSPDGYRFLPPPNGATYDAAQSQATAQAFYDVGLPVSTASYADKLFSEAMANPPSAQQLEASRQQGMVQLHKTFGASTQLVIDTAQAEFKRMLTKAPHLAAMADLSGIGNNAMLIASLYHGAVAKGRGPK